MSVRSIFKKVGNFFRDGSSQKYDDAKTERRRANKRARMEDERKVRMQQASLSNNHHLERTRFL